MKKDPVPAIGNFAEALAILGGRETRKVANNTYLVALRTPSFLSRGGMSEFNRPITKVALQLHGTYIIMWDMLGGCVLDTGGWKTITTMKRINRFCKNHDIVTYGGHWWVRGVGATIPTFIFFEGMDLGNLKACRSATLIHNTYMLAQHDAMRANVALMKELNKAEEFKRRSEAAKKGWETKKASQELEDILDAEFEAEEQRLAAARAARREEYQ